MVNGNFVPQKVLDYVAANPNMKNKLFHIEGDRKEFEAYFVDKDGIIERVGRYDDDKLEVIQVTLAAIQTVVVAGGGAATDVSPVVPSEAHIKMYVDSLTTSTLSDQNGVSKDFIYANFGMVEYQVLATDPITVRYITKKDGANLESTVHTIYTSADSHPKAVADVKALEEVLNPIDGLIVQVLSELPIISMYVFNTNAPKGVASGDSTVGYWNRIGESGYHAKNKLASTDDVSNSTGTDAANVLDGDNTTGWTSATVTDASLPEIWEVTPTAPFRPNGYSLERTSTGVFSDIADEANEGEPVSWAFSGKLADGTWVKLDERTESVIKDSGPIFYPLMGVDNEYTDFRFEFYPGVGNFVTLSEVKITEVESDDAIGLVTANASDVY